MADNNYRYSLVAVNNTADKYSLLDKENGKNIIVTREQMILLVGKDVVDNAAGKPIDTRIEIVMRDGRPISHLRGNVAEASAPARPTFDRTVDLPYEKARRAGQTNVVGVIKNGNAIESYVLEGGIGMFVVSAATFVELVKMHDVINARTQPGINTNYLIVKDKNTGDNIEIKDLRIFQRSEIR